jgi:ionotropic glutamate receptor
VPTSEKPGLLSFLNPLSLEIWIYTLAATLVLSFILMISARFSPYEWESPCDDEEKDLENPYTLSNSIWFSVATLVGSGSDVSPKAVSTRLVGVCWWFFTLIIISSYTANLVSSLTVENVVLPIQSAEDLPKQNVIQYGTLLGGSTMSFFKVNLSFIV